MNYFSQVNEYQIVIIPIFSVKSVLENSLDKKSWKWELNSSSSTILKKLTFPLIFAKFYNNSQRS